MILRFCALGVLTFVFGDIKGEYNGLARFLGVEPPVLGPGSGHRLNRTWWPARCWLPRRRGRRTAPVRWRRHVGGWRRLEVTAHVVYDVSWTVTGAPGGARCHR